MATTTSIVVDDVRVDQVSGHITVRVHSVTTDGVDTWIGPTRGYGLDASQFISQFNSDISQVTAWIASQHTSYNGANLSLVESLGALTGSVISGPPLSQVATPTFSPAAGSYEGEQSIAISCSTSGASIYYTTDGSTPTTGSTKYTVPISLSSSKTIKAIATVTGFTASEVATGAFIVVLTAAATPVFHPPAASYGGDVTLEGISISCATPGASIYYTTDGTTPTEESTWYSESLPAVTVTTTFKAIATAPGFTASAVATATYVIEN